jgi:NADPH-dependent 2,4-dienoyl-CoA reductase/sulfur reductase-like enzyme
MVGAENSPPYDRPNVSKDYLTGEAPDEWMPLESADFYRDRRVTLRLGTSVSAIDTAQHVVRLADGESIPFGALLIATGAEPVRLPIPGAEQSNVHYLRTDRDAKAIIQDASSGARAVVIGASFIGLEVAAALRARGVDVDIVAPESVPLERILGREIGTFIQTMHEAHGVRFHLGQGVTAIAGRTVTLGSGATLEVDFIVVGVGVRPRSALAEHAGLAVERGIVVDEFLQTSEPGIFAAGDVARYINPLSGESVRIEHWVVAGRQGQAAARNMLGQRTPYDVVPFFWTQQYDVSIRYVGHAETWDEVRTDGSLQGDRANGFSATFLREGRRLAVATVGRDIESLTAEAEFEAAIRALGRAGDSTLDQTIADSFPASDPPSTLPNPTDDTAIG